MPTRRPPTVPHWEPSSTYHAWETFVAALRRTEEPLSAILSQCGVACFDRVRVRLATPRGFDHRQLAPGSDMHGALSAALSTHFADDTSDSDTHGVSQIELITEDARLPGLPSVALAQEHKKRALAAKVWREAESSPEIQQLVRDFEGKIMSVEPLISP